MEATIFEKYRIFLLRDGVSEKTIKDYYFWHTRKFFEHTDCKLIDFWDKKKFQKAYDKIIIRNITNEWKKKYLKCMRRFADFLIDEWIIEENAPRTIKPPKVQTSLPIPVEDEEIHNIFLAIQRRWHWSLAYRNKIIVETFLNTWLRRSELINLRREHVKNDCIFVKNWKWSKDRIVYISNGFSAIFQDYLKKTDWVSDYVFFSLRSEKISIRAMSRIFEEIKKEANIEKLHAHKMRHTYASKVLEKWINLAVLRDQLGHTNIATTNTYIAVCNWFRRDAMKEFKVI